MSGASGGVDDFFNWPLRDSAMSSRSSPRTTEHASSTRHAAYCSDGLALPFPWMEDRQASNTDAQCDSSTSWPLLENNVQRQRAGNNHNHKSTWIEVSSKINAQY